MTERKKKKNGVPRKKSWTIEMRGEALKKGMIAVHTQGEDGHQCGESDEIHISKSTNYVRRIASVHSQNFTMASTTFGHVVFCSYLGKY
jgi:hypothetical protein